MVHRRQRSLECCRTDLVAGGIAVMLWSLVTMARASTTVIPCEQVSSIVSSGPFRFSRNPIYLAAAITYVGDSQLIHSWWPLLLLPGIVVAIARMVTDRQGNYLTERFGKVYRQYRAPRLPPDLNADHPAAPHD